jgi:hypothetical protein
MGTARWAGTAYPSRKHEFTQISGVVCVNLSLVLWSFFFWPLCCLSFDLLIMIAALVSSSSSYFWVFQIINIYSISVQNRVSESLASQSVVLIRDWLWKKRFQTCFITYQQCPSPHTIALTDLTAPPSTQLLSTQTLMTYLKISW